MLDISLTSNKITYLATYCLEIVGGTEDAEAFTLACGI